MSDLKLFRMQNANVSQLAGGGIALEKSLQHIFEKNLDALLGVRFLASEFCTTDGGRMDTLGVDENGSPVVIEYKRATNENVINQGLFYLNWLMDHRKDFEWLVLEQLGQDEAKLVDWSGPRLICIAGDFTRYDEHAVRQMGRNIDLIRYRKFDEDLLLLEQLTSATAPAMPSKSSASTTAHKYTTVSEYLDKAGSDLRELYDSVDDYLQALGDDVTVKTTDYYVAYRRIKNFTCAEVRIKMGHVLLFVKLNPDSVELEEGFTRDVRNIGHYGTGDLEVTIRDFDDFEKAKPLLERAYNEG